MLTAQSRSGGTHAVGIKRPVNIRSTLLSKG